ncbi:uncharacterized protein si:dkey-28a3.2 [Hypomesus transpacificus]|uniref:uncharacterized protein si:dkey-28a3.2 n=1 Tax=Hypomesus transpacificus TaxID=137520 RepID=UPI001F0784CD|nr:uncharacterized protein si:dkey-28a3.2 [Hypomesus transpacificus]
MPSSNERGGAGSPRSQRYRPAAEFDDATLAQKREYWRTKKREQRAKLSERRGKPISNTLNSNASHTRVVAGPPLLNSDGSYQTEVANASGLPVRGKGDAEHTDTACQNQKERWFQRIKLNKVLPQFPASNPGPDNQPPGAAVNRPVMSAKSNGALLNHASSVPQVRVTTLPSVSAPRQLQGGTRTLNGSSPGGSTQQNLATRGASGPNVLNKNPATVHIQPRLLKANVTTGTNMGTSHFASVLMNRPVERGANATQLVGKKTILGVAFRDKGMSEKTEEERAAKRREQWRIKKREQRAKQAAKVATAREKTPNVVPQKARQFVKVVLERPSTVLNREGQWQCFGRARTPLTTAGRLLKNAKAVAASNAVPRHASVTIKKEASDLPSGLAKITTTTNNVNRQSVQVKVKTPPEVQTTAHTAASASTGHNRAGGDPSRRLGGHVTFSHINRGMVRSRTPRQRFIEIQRTFLGQRNIKARSPSLSTAFIPSRPPREDPFETPEQKAARRREYWRVKKREQRAKLTVEVKAKMKEKDALTRRVKRYQSILQDMRKARAAGCYSLSQPIGSSHASASETIGGFIKEDGTVTIPHMTLKTSEKPEGGESQNASRNVPLGSQMRAHPPPPPLRPAQVKVSCPPLGLSVTKPPRLLSIRPRTDLQTPVKNPTGTHTFVVQPTTQITLSHPQNVLNAFPTVSLMGAKPASCVMQMAVTSSRPIAAPPNPGPELSEEERMAKKREYWRVKKREQRAARAARLKQGLGHGRASITLQRRRNQRPKPVRRIAVTNTKLNIQSPANTSSSTPTKKTTIKQEMISGNDPILKSEQTASVDVKPPPSSLLPTQEAQPESDPALSADSQATTLLAVASMKKLLEESLSNVTESKSQQTDELNKPLPCKTEPQTYITEDGSELEMKPRIPLLSLGDEEEEEKGSTAGDLALGDKCCQANPVTPPSCQANTSPPNPDVKVSPSSRDPHPLNPSCTETSSLCIPPNTLPSREALPHAATCTSGNPQPPFPRRAQRLRDKKAGQHHCCSPDPSEPPKLHHPPLLQEQHTSKQEHGGKQQSPLSVPEQSSSLQKKREYWRLMKRQQRARSKARQREGFKQGDYSRRLALKAAQTPNALMIKNSKPVQKVLQAPLTLRANASPILQPISSPVSGAHASLTAVTNIPTLLVVSPTVANAGQPPDTLQVKPPIVSSPPQQVHVKIGTLQASPSLSPVSLPVGARVAVSPLRERKDGMLILVENKQEAAPGSNSESPHVRKWSLQVQDVANPDIPTLTPPANPLASIKLLPIEPRPSFKLAVTSTPAPVKSPCALNPQSGKTHSPAMSWLPITTMGPPKPMPGESEEETLRRKREYWRVKKKEQRARKAMRDRELSQKRASTNWKTLLPAQDQLETQEQYSSQWINTSEESDFILSTSTETDLDYFTNLDHTAPIEDEADVFFPDDEDNMDDCEISEGVWRHRYLMDHDPLNQLLVCMVCGDLQYSHSVEGVTAHIEEAHPETLGLGVPERRGILEAWDEQVSRRERFFTSQLQQHGAPVEGDSTNLPVETEVMDPDTKATRRQ